TGQNGLYVRSPWRRAHSAPAKAHWHSALALAHRECKHASQKTAWHSVPVIGRACSVAGPSHSQRANQRVLASHRLHHICGQPWKTGGEIDDDGRENGDLVAIGATAPRRANHAATWRRWARRGKFQR